MDAKALEEPNAGMGEFVFLDNTRYDFRDEKLTVLGGTLFNLPRKEIRGCIDDYYRRYIHINGWGPREHFEAHKATRRWLLHTSTDVENEDPERVVIILTHYSPTRHYASVSVRNPGFLHTTDLKWLNRFMSRNVRLWAFGSTHFNCDFVDWETDRRFYSNQGQLLGECEPFSVEKTIDVPTT
ncbi:hypothetical protein M434DRAFT_391994 [Hypoxylon sp. CO27-5]|nr:hypothetical protein M434DRAFT_391994 [Hypoxylon sp. CO27-5]